MRSISRDNPLVHYRHIALGAGCLIGIVMLLAVFDAATGLLDGWMHWGLIGLGLAALAMLYMGHARLRDILQQAERTTRAALETAHTDALTGALNRAYFLKALGERVNHRTVEPCAYIQIDMDHLKTLNDGNGHATGDAALVHLVSCIRAELPEAVVGRLGGDEFGVMIPGTANKAAVRRIARQLQSELRVPVKICGHRVQLSATMGIAIAPEDSSSVDELISKADLALYEGKRRGRNGVVLYDSAMRTEERYKRFIERELRAAVLMNELEVYYQPIYATGDKSLRYCESLVRWAHPVRGMIPPSDFIPVAEKSDLIDILGDWVLRQVCRDIKRLNAPKVNVNVSAAQLRRTDFATRFAAILEASGVAGNRLVVEITETVPLISGSTEKANLDALRQMEVGIAIDDFGAGNASLDYIKRFSFDVLKIDKSYVDAVARNPIDAMMVTAICRIARTAGMEVIAEGVETEEQFGILRKMRCTAVQGYLLGRPQPLKVHLAATANGGDVVSAA